MGNFLGVRYNDFLSPYDAIIFLYEGILESIDEYKYIASKNAGYDIGWKRAAEEWFASGYKEWFNEIIENPLFEIFCNTGSKEWDIGRIYKAVGKRLMQNSDGENVKILETIRDAILWNSLPENINDIIENGMPGKILEFPNKQSKENNMQMLKKS